MEISFNELSVPVYENKHLANEGVVKFIKSFNEVRKKGIKKIRSSSDSHEILLSENYSLNSWLIDKDFTSEKNLKDLLFSTIIKPFIKVEDPEIEETFLSNYYYFEDLETGFAKTETFGLATSHLYKIPSISFDKLDAFKKNILNLKILPNNKQGESEANILNIYSPECINIAHIKSAFELLGNIELTKSKLSAAEKKANRHLSDHHGIKTQNLFCTTLEKSDYVMSIRSTGWGGDKFIRKCYENGQIEIVMHWTTKHYSFLVQTTGKNLRETNEIAKNLTKKYNK